MDSEKLLKSNQEQAVASWVQYLNQVRLDRLHEALNVQEKNLSEAMQEMNRAIFQIQSDIIERNRGGTYGIHGYIAEVAECGIENARKKLQGKAPLCVWVNDNGPVDIRRGTQDIQMKFVQSGGHLSLQAIRQHSLQYPDFLKQGGIYQIPEDHYQKIQYYLSISAEDAQKMATGTGEFSIKQWQEVQNFQKLTGIRIQEDVEPSLLAYDEVQKDAICGTMEQEKVHLAKENQKLQEIAYAENSPTFAEGIKATAASAAVEGMAAFVQALIQKRRSGTHFSDFTPEDWKEIAGKTGKGTLQGGIRGFSIYTLTNCTAAPASAASAAVTASFGIAEQLHLFRTGTINAASLIENSEMLCMDAAVSSLSSFVGQVLIPVPILGAVIGNTVGCFLYQVGKDFLTVKEQSILQGYLEEIQQQNARLEVEYQETIAMLRSNFLSYLDLLESAFSPDVEAALDASVSLAQSMDIPTEELLCNHTQVVSYFMD